MRKRNASFLLLLFATLLAVGYFFFRPSDARKTGVSSATSAVQGVTNRTTYPDMHRSLGTSENSSADVSAQLSEVERLLELRKAGKIDEYIQRTRNWLETNRMDLLATDVMTLYARSGNTNEFQTFGIWYATNSPGILMFVAFCCGRVYPARTVSITHRREVDFLSCSSCFQKAAELAVKRYVRPFPHTLIFRCSCQLGSDILFTLRRTMSSIQSWTTGVVLKICVPCFKIEENLP